MGCFVGKQYIAEEICTIAGSTLTKSKEFMCLDPTIVACKYFDQQFDDFSDSKGGRTSRPPTLIVC